MKFPVDLVFRVHYTEPLHSAGGFMSMNASCQASRTSILQKESDSFELIDSPDPC